MQMQPINPLGPLVAGAKDTQTNSGENFLDSLQSVHSKADTVSNEQFERITAAQQDDGYATAPAPVSKKTTATPKQSQKESDDHIEPAAIDEQSTVGDEKLIAADMVAGKIMPQIVVETPSLNSKNGLQQSAGLMQEKANNLVPQRSAFAMPAAPQLTVPQQVDFNAMPADNPVLSQTMVGEVLPDQFPTTPPQDSETGNLTPSTTQSDGTTTLTDSRFVEILGLTAAPGSETVQRLVPQKQRSWEPVVESPVTDPAGQKTEARMVAQKISDQFMNESGTDNPGKDILWTKPADSLATATHTPGNGEPTELLHSMVPSQNTIPTAVISQEGATARIPTGLGVAENRIIDHVIQQVSIRSNPKQSSISIRLHPEELGHLKMELVLTNETIKAHIQVQTQQVQDILEKNLARLREGFEQQGLVLDEIQVSVNSESRSGPGLFKDQHATHASPQTASSTRTQESDDIISEESMITPHQSDFIISLRI
jgi:flagellar hook-length control protein FliK